MKRLFRIIKFVYYRYMLRDAIGYHRHLGTEVGSGCRIYPYNFSSEPFLISIGDRVTITSGVRLLTHDGAAWLVRDEKGRRFSYKRIIIHNDVFIGIDSIILPGVEIESNVIIAAGSVVTKSVPSGKIVAGNPARIIGEYERYKNDALTHYAYKDDNSNKLDFKDWVLSVLDKSKKPILKA